MRSRKDNRREKSYPRYDEESVRGRHEMTEDDRYNQTDWAPQDRYNEIPQDRHRRNYQERVYAQLNRSPTRSFKYHYSEDDLDSRENEPRRRAHHYREY